MSGAILNRPFAVPQEGSRVPLPSSIEPASFQNKYVLKFRVRGGKAYLADYSMEMGVRFGVFEDAKWFSSLPTARRLSNLLNAEVVRVQISPNDPGKIALVPRLIPASNGNGTRGREPDASHGVAENKINPAIETKAIAGANGGGSEDPPSFLIRAILTTKSAQLSDGKKLLFNFISAFLNVECLSLQSSFGHGPDLLMFRCPLSHSTLAVSVDVMLQEQSVARNIVATKLEESKKRFQKA